MACLGEKELFLLDMDGTIYLDRDLFPWTIPFLEAVKANGCQYRFLTNNSSKSGEDYINKLAGMGIHAVREEFVTSVDALIADLRARPSYRLCYVFGTRSFQGQLRSAGVPVTDRREDGVDCLVIGFDTELTFQKLEDACILLNRGVDFVAANLDWVCPTWYGSVPDCGSVCEMLFRATGRRPRVIGKPRPAMAKLAMERAGAAPERTVMVGDRLYTDIAAGVNAGIDTAFVLSGEGTRADLEASEVQPTWVFDNIAALHRAWEEERAHGPAH
ncbi:MAG: HAD-IIA family hydrolase [Oscillospiraceae bacterium]|nr:HAD-IIA family hydrolase [Oscillospiraceae bacterium]